MINSVCVFCSSRNGPKEFGQAAKELGKSLASHNIKLIYGGGNLGLMGITANAVLENGGQILGILPTPFLSVTDSPGETIQVPDMHTRKQLFLKHSDCFIALGGGWGTMEELFECITWRQLNIHSKPIHVLNTLNFYQPVKDWIASALEHGFISDTPLVLFHESVESLLEAVLNPVEVNGIHPFNWDHLNLI